MTEVSCFNLIYAILYRKKKKFHYKAKILSTPILDRAYKQHLFT